MFRLGDLFCLKIKRRKSSYRVLIGSTSKITCYGKRRLEFEIQIVKVGTFSLWGQNFGML